jgi:hypothetical protein
MTEPKWSLKDFVKASSSRSVKKPVCPLPDLHSSVWSSCPDFLDHVQITALSRALQINVDIAYIDGRNVDGDVNFVELRHASDPGANPITLLYRYAPSQLAIL